MNDEYDDIIEMEHPEPKNHPRMSMEQRAAQFAPFVALRQSSEFRVQSSVGNASEMHGCVATE